MIRTVQILAMRTWGELGNLLAAKTLAAVLAQQLTDADIKVIEAEALFPRFADIGNAIERLAKMRYEPGEIHERYLELMDELAHVFYRGFEAADKLDGALATEVQTLVQHFQATKPDLVIGMKGVISRLCLSALRIAKHSVPVVNFVTNEGLLLLEIHRSAFLPYNLVPFESARRYLLEEHGFEPARVQTVGRLIAQTELSQFLERKATASSHPQVERELSLPDSSAARLVVFCNRGGTTYLKLLDHLAERHSQLAMIFIGYNDPFLTAAADRLRMAKGIDHWRVFNRLEQGDYVRYLRWLAEAEYPLLVSKTGPNTMLEAAYFGIPQLLLNSGLPMEQWVGPFLEETDIGRGFETMDQLIDTLDQWLDNPHLIAERKKRARDFGRVTMDQEETRERVGAVFQEILRVHSAPRGIG